MDARRLVLASQGYGAQAPAVPGRAHARKVVDRLRAIQIDSVNVLVRAHYMPMFSRLGPYDRTILDDLVYERRELFEYWGHAACFMPVELHPLLRWRMDANKSTFYWQNTAPKVKKYIEAVYQEVADRGPLAASELTDPGKAEGPWWGWSQGKSALEWLFRHGRLAVARRRNFERLYDLAERVIPKAVLEMPAPDPDEARKALLLQSAKAQGVATARDLARYFNIDQWWERPTKEGRRPPSVVPRLVKELVEDGRLVRTDVEGWKQQAYVAKGTKSPRSVEARALVSPFDALLWERKRAKDVFGFDYTIEIYVPKPKRKFGYYVLPFPYGDTFAARVDLKADRKTSTLLVPGAFAEPNVDRKQVAEALGAELRSMAGWLGLERIRVERRGDLARGLARSVLG